MLESRSNDLQVSCTCFRAFWVPPATRRSCSLVILQALVDPGMASQPPTVAAFVRLLMTGAGCGHTHVRLVVPQDFPHVATTWPDHPWGHCVPLPQGNGRPSGANSPLSWVTGFQEYAEADSDQAVASGPSRGLCEHCSSTLSSPYPVCREDVSGESWEGGAFGGHPQCAGLEFSRLQLLPEM